MNKADLINAIAVDTGLSKTDSKKALESVVKTISKALERGERVNLVGFGTFSVACRSARQGINPATKQPIAIPEKKTPKFKGGTDLCNAVNK